MKLTHQGWAIFLAGTVLPALADPVIKVAD